jgi:hypothetical protein
MKEQSNRSEITIGLDLGERWHRFCVLNGKGEVVEEGTLGNERASLARLTARYRGALAVMEKLESTRYRAGMPRVTDGALLFLQTMLAKMLPPEQGGSRIAIIFNGSPLSNGDCGSGESEIRRWDVDGRTVTRWSSPSSTFAYLSLIIV